MATAIYVPGPTVVKIGASILGYSDNDNLPQIQFTDHHHEIKTVLSGAVPEEVVLQGTHARIAIALVKWDNDVYQTMLADQRGAAATTTVGRRIVAASAYFSLTIESVNGTSEYVFPVSYLQPESISDSQWGNRERVLTLNFMAIPDGNGALYTFTA
jgi:hypothetical protein